LTLKGIQFCGSASSTSFSGKPLPLLRSAAPAAAQADHDPAAQTRLALLPPLHAPQVQGQGRRFLEGAARVPQRPRHQAALATRCRGALLALIRRPPCHRGVRQRHAWLQVRPLRRTPDAAARGERGRDGVEHARRGKEPHLFAALRAGGGACVPTAVYFARERDFARAGDSAVAVAEEIFAIRSRSRARIYPRATPLDSNLRNIASVFEELLEENFCGFVKFIKIASSFKELLEMLLM